MSTFRKGALGLSTAIALAGAIACDSSVEPQDERALILLPLAVMPPASGGATATVTFMVVRPCGPINVGVSVDRRPGKIAIAARLVPPSKPAHCAFEPEDIIDTVRVIPFWTGDSTLVHFAQPSGSDSVRILRRGSPAP